MSLDMSSPFHIAVVGGGLIGLSIARELSVRGKVTVFDKPRASAASKVGAGLLIPVGGRISKHHFALKSESAALYPRFVQELEKESGLSCGYLANGTLTVAYEPKADSAIGGLASCIGGFGVEVERLSAEQCRQREPRLCSQVGAGFQTTDGQVDPIALRTSLRHACEGRGVEILEKDVRHVSANSVVTSEGAEWPSDVVVVAAGAWIAELLNLPVFPVKGEVIGTRVMPDFLTRNLIVQRESLYVANRGDGRLVIGSTEEEVGFCEEHTGDQMLWEKACRLLPDLADHEIEVRKVGFRPKVGDGLPIMGCHEGIYVAGAHYRNGILLTPITSKLMAELILEGRTSDLMSPYTPSRELSPR